MKLLLKRNKSTKNSTIGSLYVDGKFQCFTLEDVIRDMKVFGETAIPEGKYKVIINKSARFKVDLPLLLNVPNYEGIRIHPGNTDKDTEGCILVGQTVSEQNTLVNSRVAFNALMDKLKTAISIEIEVVNA